MLHFLFGIFLTIGLFFVALDLFKVPTLAVTRAIANANSKNEVSYVDVFIANSTLKLSKHIKINDFKKIRLKNVLNASGINKTPEEYTANCVVKSLIIGIWTIPLFFVLPIVAPAFLIIGLLTYFKEIRRADDILNAKKEQIEVELPRFVATLTKELQNSRDILRIIDNYKLSSSKIFAKELDVLTADMRSGSYENALTRFESKLNSAMLSDIIRGLIAVLRGDDGVVYFKMLSHDMKLIELQKLKQQAMKIPAKIRKYSGVMLFCFIGLYMVILVYQLIISMTGMF